MKYLISLIVFIFIGCGSSSYFVFDTNNPKSSKFTKITKYVAINEIELPNYLKQDHLAVIKDHKVVFLKQKWAEPMDISLEKELISYLLNNLPLYGVLKYPWQKEIKAEVEISIHINDFIYKNGETVLEGYYLLKKGDSQYKKTFSFKEKNSNKPEDITKTMRNLYKKLEEEIRKRIIS